MSTHTHISDGGQNIYTETYEGLQAIEHVLPWEESLSVGTSDYQANFRGDNFSSGPVFVSGLVQPCKVWKDI